MGQFQIGGTLASTIHMCLPITGGLSQSGVYPTDNTWAPAPDPIIIWEETATRYTTRAHGAGWTNAQTLRIELLQKVKMGRLADPPPLGGMDNAPPYAWGRAIYVFDSGSNKWTIYEPAMT